MTKTRLSPNLLWILGLFLLARLLYLFFVHPAYLFTLDYAGEELYRGAVAHELIHGLTMPLWDFRPDEYTWGWAIVAGLASLSFRIFGETLFALKLVPLVFSIGGFIFWFLFVKKQFGEKTASLFAFLFIFAPATFIRYSFTGLGDHTETVFFTGLSLYLFLGVLSGGKKAPILAAFLGLFTGMGIWFSYTFLVTPLCIVLFWFLQDSKLLKNKSFWFYILFALLGFSPWLLYNLQSNFSGLTLYNEPLWTHFHVKYALEAFRNMHHFVGYQLMRAFAVDRLALPLQRGIFLSYAILVGLALLLFLKEILLKKRTPLKSSPELILVLFSVIYCLTLQLSLFSEMIRNTRFWMPLFPFLFCMASIGISKLSQPILQRTLLGGFIALSLFSQHHLLSLKFPGSTLKLKGYSYSYTSAYTLEPSNARWLKNYSKFERKLNAEEKHQMAMDLALETLEPFSPSNFQEKTEEVLAQIPDALRSYFFYALGGHLFVMHQDQIEGGVNNLHFLRVYGQSAMDQAMRGYLMTASRQTQHRIKESLNVSSQEWLWKARGAQMGLKIREATFANAEELNQRIRETQADVPKGYQAFFLQGLGYGLYWLWAIRPYGSLSHIKLMDELQDSVKENLFYGIGIAHAREGHPQITRALLEKELSPPAFQSLLKGFEDQVRSFT